MGGIPVDAVRFYEELTKDNSREFWTANKQRYEDSVREPFAGPPTAWAGTSSSAPPA